MKKGKIVARYISAFFRQRASLGCEMVAMRSQLTFYEESIRQKRQPRPRFNPAFRLLWVLLSRVWSGTTSFGNTNGARISPDGKSVFAADGDTYLRAYDIKGKLIYAAEGDLLEPFDVERFSGRNNTGGRWR